jgi:hypothetical protein
VRLSVPRVFGWRLLIVFVLVFARAAHADETADRLRHVLTLARQGLWDEAVSALPEFAALERDHLPLLQSVTQALSAQRPSPAAHVLAAMRRLDPDSARPRAALEALWAANPTLDKLWASDLREFPVVAETNTFGGKAIVTLAVKPFVSVQPATEPRSGVAYPGAVNVYAEVVGRLSLRFVVHTAQGVNAERGRQVGRFLEALSEMTDPVLGPINRASYPMPVWLATTGEPGARQWNGSITVQATNHPRSDLEWVRELAHEWGHACLPGVGGFTEPEAWANGDLGERLFLPMMAETGRVEAWDKGVDAAAYTRRGVDALRDAFAKSGPVPTLLAETGRKGYAHFLGACLYVKEAYGMALLVAALDGAGGGGPADFLRAFEDELAARPHIQVMRAGRAGPRPICIPRAGRYSLDGREVRRNGRPLKGALSLSKGWQFLEWEGMLALRRAADGRAITTPRNR